MLASDGSSAMRSWLLWQLLDSAFPTGAFAHSGGVETAAQAALLRPGDEAALEAFLLGQNASAASLALPFLTAAHAAGAASPPRPAAAVSLSALLAAHHAAAPAARRASEAAGAALLRAAGAAFHTAAPALAALRVAMPPGAPMHGPVAFGYVCGAVGVPAAESRRGFLFSQLRDACSAACRLGLVGPMAAAALQARLAPACEASLERAPLSPDDAASAAPLADAVHLGHDALFSRLFQS